MQKDPLRNIPVMLTCIVLLAPIGCGGGGSSSSSGSGETTYTLGGTLAGLSAGQSVGLEDNGGDKLTLSANGAFSFPMRLAAGTAYAITVQSHTPGIACSVSNGSGTVGSSDVTGIGVSCSVGTERILYSFGANATDGQEPYAGVITDSAGNLYGTTQTGGANGLGTVFKITAAGTETILHSFGSSATDGQTPRAGVIMDNAGNLYGTTSKGGANQIGTVFKIDTAGTETILYSFGARANDGMDPDGGLIMDSARNLYGMTSVGGSGGTGTVYKIDPADTETILYSFGIGNTDGAGPYGGLIMDSAGNLYGTTTQGGANFEGTVFKITAAGTETILHSFGATATDGLVPTAGLIMDRAGNLYGTTAQGGANVLGTVFKIDAAGTETILYSFAASATDGLAPFAGLTVDSAGNLYGTTVNGGANFGTTMNGEVNGGGTVFVID